MMLKATQEGAATRYSLLIDNIEKERAGGAMQPGDREFIMNSIKSPLVSEKLCALAMLVKRIEDSAKIADAIAKATHSNGNNPAN